MSSPRAGGLPLRVRLVAGFAATMLVVLAAAGGFVYWRVRYALDLRLRENLDQQASDLRAAAAAHPTDPAGAVEAISTKGRLDQLLSADGTVLATGQELAADPLVPPARLTAATQAPSHYDIGNLWSHHGKHLRVTTFPLRSGQTRIAVTAVRMDQRDEALRELLAQLALANALALAVASGVGYRLARAALAPVERYRAQAAQITAGASGVRLDVPTGTDDEITRLGHTLNTMLAAQDAAAVRQRQFIADASHELRTPLTLLTSEVELALRRPRSREELEETLREVAGDTQRLVSLAETLLGLEVAEETLGQRAPINARTALEAAARRARAVLPADSPRHVDIHASPELVVPADATALDRILANLAENAAHHGHDQITFSAEPVEAAVSFLVHDNGNMPAAFVPEAADRFRRADSARTTPGAGLGLGLVDALARAHHGQLRICSNSTHHARPTPNPALAALPCTHPASGTSITVLLPAG